MKVKKKPRAERHKKRWRRVNRMLNRIVLSLSLVVMIFFVTGCAIKLLSDEPNINIPPHIANAPTLDPHAGALVTPTPAPTEPGIAIAGWSKISIPANTLEANVALYNPAENEGLYSLTFELRLKNGNEVVFSTGLIPPGMYCNKVKLSRAFEPGEYPAILHVQPYRMDEEQLPTNNAELELMLIVK